MDRGDQPSQQDELVYCHECENEWLRRQHGIICPECQSDFTEIIEANFDPRAAQQPANAGQDELYAPDPEEDDIDGLQFEQTAPNRFHLHGTFNRDFAPGAQRAGGDGAQHGPLGGGLMGIIGNMLQNVAQQPIAQQRQPGNQPGPDQDRPSSASGSPTSDGFRTYAGEHERPDNGTFIRHGGGPGFRYTIASSNMNFVGGPQGLQPRNANGPQPFQQQPQQFDAMLQMIMNIGAGRDDGFGGVRPYGFGDVHDDGFAPVMFGGPGNARGGQGMAPFANLFETLNLPRGQIGDYASQEALDRIITQLMEQHQSGNAPGPASEAAIRSLPTRPITEKDMGENGKADCSICMDEVALGATVTELPCSHWFHADCIKAWLTEHDTCPHCRQGIMPKEGEGQPGDRARESSQAPLNDMHSPEYTRNAYFPRQNSTGDAPLGSEQNPYSVPDSPTTPRRRSSGDPRRVSTGGSGGMFSRMREAFGRSPSNNNAPGNEDTTGSGNRM